MAGNDQYTKVLLHCNGVDASTAFIDDNYGGAAHIWTANDNAQIDTAEFKFGGSSGLFDGTGDYVSTPDHADYNVGSGDFTVDFWFNCTAATGIQSLAGGQANNTATAAGTSIRLERNTADKMQGWVFIATTGYNRFSTTSYTNITNPGWHHYALVRTGDTLKLFLDGVQETADLALPAGGVVQDIGNDWAIGRLGEFPTNPWFGWVDEFRLSVGIARWTSDFTPPTQEYSGPPGTQDGLSQHHFPPIFVRISEIVAYTLLFILL